MSREKHGHIVWTNKNFKTCITIFILEERLTRYENIRKGHPELLNKLSSIETLGVGEVHCFTKHCFTKQCTAKKMSSPISRKRLIAGLRTNTWYLLYFKTIWTKYLIFEKLCDLTLKINIGKSYKSRHIICIETSYKLR